MLKTRGFLLTLAYCVWGLVLFVIFTVAYFPFKQMFDAAFAPRGLSLSYEELRFAFPVGITLSQAKLTLPAYSSTFELQSSETTLRPVLTSFLWARPTLAIESKLYRGSAQVFVSRQEARNIGLWFEVVNVDLAKLNQLSGAAGSVSGLVSSRGELVLDQAGTPAGPGHIDLEAKNVVIRLGTGIFSLSFTTLGGALALDPQKLVGPRLGVEHGRSGVSSRPDPAWSRAIGCIDAPAAASSRQSAVRNSRPRADAIDHVVEYSLCRRVSTSTRETD